MELNFFKIIGALGLLLISAGLLVKDRKRQNILYIIGGISLEVYSVYLKDTIFIVLQIIFTISAIYDLLKLNKQ